MKLKKIFITCCGDCPFYDELYRKCYKGAEQNLGEEFFEDCPLAGADETETIGVEI